MTERSAGDAAQIRAIAEQLVKTAIIEVREQEASESVKFTPAVKWMSGIAATMIVLFCAWSVKTLNDVQLSVAEIRMQLGQSGAIETRFSEINRRIERLERLQAQEDRGQEK